MHSDIPQKSEALSILKKFYGYPSFYPLQYEAIEQVLNGKDAVVLMPTGGGKSICFQIPALMRQGCAVVISPLISLMKDQVDALITNGIPAAAINSSQTESYNNEVFENAFRGRIKIIYISPERLLSDIDRWPKDVNISLFAIDEAHCISQWGHDFRPEYTQLSQLKAKFPHVPIMALTATADKLTRQDISKQLGIPDAKLFLTSFDRKNLSLNVEVLSTARQKMQKIQQIIKNHASASGIIYCMSRKTTETVAEKLKALGYNAACYHAGMSTSLRERIQQDFLNDDIQIMCATVAFGMGINKSNIRWIIHYNMPKDMESYYQEIGRAGRDGLPGDTYMLYSYSDVIGITSLLRGSGQKILCLEKLKRMEQYAESHVCRRRILLSYFNEPYDHDCGNCDVCYNPPQRIDGTQLAQMALSAIIRCEEKIGISMLIDILRGSQKVDLIAKNFHKIKTYGMGHDLSYFHWNYYIVQMLQLGLIDIAYDESNVLKITSYGKEVVYGKRAIELNKFVPNTKLEKENQKVDKVTDITKMSRTLFETLKALRFALAKNSKVPPYVIFNDKTLTIMASVQPTTHDEFASIYGVGEVKAEKYWKVFTDEISKYKSKDNLLSL